MERLKEAFPDSNIQYNEPLSNYTFTKTGGLADAVVLPESSDEIVALVRFIHEAGLPLTVLGNASNLIVRDGGIRGVVMLLTENDEVTVEGTELTAESGATIIHVSETAQAHSLSGLEFACGIPGSSGGAVYMNAGAYGGEVKDCIKEVKVVSREGEIIVYSNEEMDFDYRHSAIQETGEIVLSVTFLLEEDSPEAIQAKMDELMDLRRAKQPLEYPSCGSVFKRPPGYFAGKLIQDAGLQGFQIGGAQVSTKHAGFIVNVDGATATDYVDVIKHIQKTILEKDGIELEAEVRIIGEE